MGIKREYAFVHYDYFSFSSQQRIEPDSICRHPSFNTDQIEDAMENVLTVSVL